MLVGPLGPHESTTLAVAKVCGSEPQSRALRYRQTLGTEFVSPEVIGCRHAAGTDDRHFTLLFVSFHPTTRVDIPARS